MAVWHSSRTNIPTGSIRSADDRNRRKGATIPVAVREVSSPPKPVVARFLRGSRSRAHEPLASTCPMFLSDCIGGARSVGLDGRLYT
jgi:hypothetical protein